MGPIGRVILATTPTVRPTPTPAPTPTQTSSGIGGIAEITNLPPSVLIIGGILVILLAGVLVFFGIIQPLRKQRLLNKAKKLIARDAADDLQAAEELLNQALVAGMGKKRVAEARFLLAFVRARRGQYAEAAATIKDLRLSKKMTREALYLDMWLQFKQEKYEEVERIYGEHQSTLRDLLDAKMIAGIAFLRLARQCWSRNSIQEALDYYQKVRRLDVKELNERLPHHIDDQQVIIGIRALLDRRIEEARNQFEEAKRTASEADRSTAQSELGLLLCDWHQKTDDMDGKLGSFLQRLQKEISPTAARAEKAASKQQDTELLVEQLLLRNALFWHVTLLIESWRQRLPANRGLPVSERARLDKRIEAVQTVDPKWADANLVSGLIAYYFSMDNNAAREAALKQLRQYRENGGNLADIISLLEREQKVIELYRRSLDRFLEIARRYLQDPSVPEKLRQKLRDRLNQFARFRQLGEIDMHRGETETSPSIEDLQNRSKLLRMRMEKIIKPKLQEIDQEAGSTVVRQVELVDKLIQELTNNSVALQDAESNLLGEIGELLLPEDESTERQTNALP